MSKTLRELKDELFESSEELTYGEVKKVTDAVGGTNPINELKTSKLRGFIKKDSGKLMMSLIEPKFVEGVAATLTMGAEKYSIDNWKLCEEPRRYKDALLRHLYAYLDGELVDPESGLSHMYHIGFNAMALDYFDRRSIDD